MLKWNINKKRDQTVVEWVKVIGQTFKGRWCIMEDNENLS